MNTERRELAGQAIELANTVCSDTGKPPAKAADLAVMLLEMAREVIRLQHVIDNIVKLYTIVDPPLAEYLRETGDL